jgi:hypothetical protein
MIVVPLPPPGAEPPPVTIEPRGMIHLDRRTTRHPGYAISLSRRWLVEKGCQIKRYFALESRFQAEFTTIFCTGLRAIGY